MATSLRPYISVFDEGFDVGKASEYRMTIQFILGGFSYLIADATSSTIIAMEAYLSDDLMDDYRLVATLKDVFAANKLSGKSLKSVTCTLGSRTCVLVPNEVFDESASATYLGFLHPSQRSCQLMTDPIDMADCVNVYSISDALLKSMQTLWPNACIHHESTVFVSSVLSKDTERTCIYIHVRNRDFDMVIVHDGKLLFFNNFKFNTKDDFLYFLLFAMEQHGLKGDDTPICFSGMILGNSEIMQLCERYIKDIRMTPNGNAFRVSSALNEIPSQYFYIPYQVL